MSGHEANVDLLEVREPVPVDVLQHLPLDKLACFEGDVVIPQHERHAAYGGRDDGEDLGETVARAVDEGNFVADGVHEVGEDTYPQ